MLFGNAKKCNSECRKTLIGLLNGHVNKKEAFKEIFALILVWSLLCMVITVYASKIRWVVKTVGFAETASALIRSTILNSIEFQCVHWTD